MIDDQQWLRSYMDSDGYSIISHSKSGKFLSLYDDQSFQVESDAPVSRATIEGKMILSENRHCLQSEWPLTGNALARVQRVHKPVDLWDITFCTSRF